MSKTYRDMCAELVAALDDATESVDRISDCVNVANYPELWAECVESISRHDGLLNRARTLLGTEDQMRRYIYNPVQIAECGGPCEQGSEHCDCGALWDDGNPAPEYDEPARFAAWLREHSSDCMELGRPDWAHMSSRAAELLDQP